MERRVRDFLTGEVEAFADTEDSISILRLRGEGDSCGVDGFDDSRRELCRVECEGESAEYVNDERFKRLPKLGADKLVVVCISTSSRLKYLEFCCLSMLLHDIE